MINTVSRVRKPYLLNMGETLCSISTCNFNWSVLFVYVLYSIYRVTQRELNLFKSLLVNNYRVDTYRRPVDQIVELFVIFFSVFGAWQWYSFLPPGGNSYWITHFLKCSVLVESPCIILMAILTLFAQIRREAWTNVIQLRCTYSVFRFNIRADEGFWN